MAVDRNRATFGKVREHERDCQRCGQRFTTKRIVPYCRACWREKHKESHAAYLARVQERASRKQARCANVED